MIARRTAAVVAATTLAVVLLAGPAGAGQGAGPGDCTGDGRDTAGARGNGPGTGGGAGWHGADATGRRQGDAAGRQERSGSAFRNGGTGAAFASGELTDAQEATLAAMAEEEKLAADLYAALADVHDSATFARVSASEARHLGAVRTLLTRYGITDPTAGLVAGEFADDAVAARYDRLLADGTGSLTDAYAAARTVEQDDLEELTAASTDLAAPDVSHVYDRLAASTTKHLDVFGG